MNDHEWVLIASCAIGQRPNIGFRKGIRFGTIHRYMLPKPFVGGCGK